MEAGNLALGRSPISPFPLPPSPLACLSHCSFCHVLSHSRESSSPFICIHVECYLCYVFYRHFAYDISWIFSFFFLFFFSSTRSLYIYDSCPHDLYIRCMFVVVVVIRVYNVVDLYLSFSLGIDRTRATRHTPVRSVCNNPLSHWALFTDRYIFILVNLNIRFYSTNTYHI